MEIFDFPRFLLSRGRFDEAKRVSQIMAKRNGNRLSDRNWRAAQVHDQDTVRYATYAGLALNTAVKLVG